MVAVLVAFVYLAAGALLARLTLPRLRPTARLWLGLSAGVFLMMWLPALSAFVFGYTLKGELIALAALLLLVLVVYLCRDKRETRTFDDSDKRALRLMLTLALPFFLYFCFVQYTHVLRPVDGGYHTGQATYGDLPLHLGIASSLRGAKLPSDYSIFPGERLAYPFLTDSLSTTLMIFGLPLGLSIRLAGALMFALVACGLVILATKLTNSKSAAVLTVLMLLLNGGLGFLYSMDMAGVSLGQVGQNQLQHGVWLDRIKTIINGWYQTPANHAEFSTYNLRWSNIVADLFLPQRTFLGGWMVLLPCLYLLYEMFEKKGSAGETVFLGIMAGGLPLIHTHSFLALGLCSLGWLTLDFIKNKKLNLPIILYGVIAVLLALPQLFTFTFGQVGASDSFLRFSFNWVNGEGGLKDGVLFFYLKNIGLPFLLLILSLFHKNSRWRFLYMGALFIWLPAEFIAFQPNIYDNNKLLYVAYLLVLPGISEYALLLYKKLEGIGGRKVLAGLCIVMMFLSGTLALVREAKSDYAMFSAADSETAEWVEKNTKQDDLFVTSTDHLNPVSALAGRRVVCGPSLWLYWHGFDIAQREDDLRLFYENPELGKDIPQKYGASYILLSPDELYRYNVDEQALFDRYDIVFESSDGSSIILKTL